MNQSTCPCGNPVEQNVGRGRPRKYCVGCSPRKEPKPRERTLRVERPCSQCGQTFAGPKGAMYCGSLCRGRAAYANKPRIPCRTCGEPTAWVVGAKKAPAEPKHKACLPEHGAARYERGCKCDICKAAISAKVVAYRAKRRANPTILCTSPGCDRDRYAQGLCVKHYKRKRRADGTWKPSPADDWRNPTRMARLAARRAVTRGATGPVERFTVDDLLERDGYDCGICGTPILREPYPHPKSPSVDHIKPLSKGGSHTLTNARAAHLRCNISRGARD